MMISSLEAPRTPETGADVRRQQPCRAALADVDHATLLDASPGGVLVVRLGRDEDPAAGDSWHSRADAVRLQPSLGLADWLQVRAHLAVHGTLACVVTVCGRPVLVADLVSFEAAGDQVELGLARPGDWAGLLDRRRLLTGPGPRWMVLGAKPCLSRAARACERGTTVNAGRSTTSTRWG